MMILDPHFRGDDRRGVGMIWNVYGPIFSNFYFVSIIFGFAQVRKGLDYQAGEAKGDLSAAGQGHDV